MKAVRVGADKVPYAETIGFMATGFANKQVLPFLGAGISIDKPACLPKAKQLADPLIQVI